MKHLTSLLFVLFIANLLIAQPGGGGNLNIERILDSNGRVIMRGDKDYDIFILPSKTNLSNEYSSFPFYSTYTAKDTSDQVAQVVLNESYSRLLIVRGSDMMLLEFEDMLSENGMGRDDLLRSVEFIPGYRFVIYRGFEKNRNSSKHIDPEWLQNFLKTEVNEKIKEGLLQRHILSNSDKERLLRMDPKVLLNQAIYYNVGLHRFEESIAFSQSVIANTDDKLLFEKSVANIFNCHLSLENYQEAKIFYLKFKDAIKKMINGYFLIDVLKKMDLKLEAFEIYNELCAQSDYAWYWYNRGMFRLETFNDINGAISDFDYVVSKCASVSLNDADIFEYCEFSKGYFSKGLLQLKMGDIENGSEHVLKSTTFYINNFQLMSYIKSVDSLVVQYPGNNNLHLAAALLYSKAATEQPIHSSQSDYYIQQSQKALSNVVNGESLYLWWMTQANLYRAMLMPYEAIDSSMNALKLSPNAKGPYRFQYVVYSTQLSNEKAKMREAHDKWHK